MSGQETRGPVVVGVTVSFLAVAVLLTITRFLTRLLIVRDFGPEDWSIGIATAFSVALTVCLCEQVHYGMGQHMSNLSPEQLVKSLKPFWVSILVYYPALTFTKISILFQYYRVIVYDRTRLAIWLMMAVVICYGIATLFDSLFLCIPISQFWAPHRAPGACANENTVWYSNAAVNIALDLAIVILPMPAIRTLSISRARKIGVMFLFALGGFVTITSIIRLYTLRIVAGSDDVTWDNVHAAIWSSVETNVGIFCACLPAIRPLISFFRGSRVTQPSSHVRIPEDPTALELSLNPKSPMSPRHPSAYGTVAFADRGRTPDAQSPGKESFLISSTRSDAEIGTAR